MRIQNGCHLISAFTQHSNVISNTFGVYSYFFSFFFLVFGDLSLYIPGWSWTPLYRPSCPWNHSNQPVTISRVLGLKSCTIPSLYHYDGISLDSQIKMKTMTSAYIVPNVPYYPYYRTTYADFSNTTAIKAQNDEEQFSLCCKNLS